jgi:hypothetical protein
MHWIRGVVAGALVSAMTLGTYQVASAGSTGTATQASAFCATAESLQGEIRDLRNVDLATVSFTGIKRTYRRFADLIKELQKEAPQSLKSSFNRLRTFYDKVVNGKVKLDITSEKSVRNFARDVQRTGKDVAKLFTYLEDTCGITFETPTTT